MNRFIVNINNNLYLAEIINDVPIAYMICTFDRKRYLGVFSLEYFINNNIIIIKDPLLEALYIND